MAKTHSGGGRTPVKGVIRNGPPNTKVISPSGAAHIGRSVGNHAEGKTVPAPKQPLVTGTRSQVASGNAVALNVGRGGPGAGRVVHASGSQGQHGPAAGSPEPQGRDILSDFSPTRKGN
jgi:hypothetical protein